MSRKGQRRHERKATRERKRGGPRISTPVGIRGKGHDGASALTQR